MKAAAKIIGLITTILWAVFVARQAYLAHVDAEKACAFAWKALNIAGKPEGYDHDIVPECP
jgi:hypothetical protein